MRALNVVSLREEELEALALADVRGLDHETAAGHMNVSRATFSRILAEAHRAVATALVEGAALKIEGGVFCLAAPGKKRGRETVENGKEGGKNAE